MVVVVCIFQLAVAKPQQFVGGSSGGLFIGSQFTGIAILLFAHC
jgi:hypothetical protein